MAAKKKNKKKAKKYEISWNVAREDDGTIQITYTIPSKIIDQRKKDTAKILARDIEVPGFRKGKAPLNKVLDHIKDSTLVDKTLQKMLPGMFGESIKKENIKPAIYPKFELIRAKDGEDWQIRAITAEMPEVKLGDYKKKIKDETAKDAIWTPEKGKSKDKKKEPSREEKEQKVIEILLDTVKVKIPKALVEEEVNARLSRLLERIDKLGLNLESYLASTNHTSESLRKEYEEQAKTSLVIDMALNKIAEKEDIEVSKKQLEEIKSGDKELSEQQVSIVKASIRKREALNNLVELI